MDLRIASVPAGLRSGMATIVVATAVLLGSPKVTAAEPLKVLVPVSPGSSMDVLARILTEQIGHTHGVPVVVENRPGAGTIIGTEIAARAAPDGNTILISGTGLVVNPLIKKTNYDPLSSFDPICRLVSLPTVLVVNGASKFRALVELINAARSEPGRLTLASIGPGSTAHIAFETLKRLGNFDITFVAFPGPAPAVTNLVGNHVTAFLGNYSDISEHLHTGTLRVLASVSPTRIEPLPSVPTLAELGFDIGVGDIWFGAMAPAGTPVAVISRLTERLLAAMRIPSVEAKLKTIGMYPAALCGEQFSALIRSESARYDRAIRDSGMRP